MSTSSTENVLAAIRTRLLAFTAADDATLGDTIGTRLWLFAPPGGVANQWPFGILRPLPLRRDGAYNGERWEGAVELMLWSRPRTAANAKALEAAADIAEAAFLRWASDDADGIVFSRGGTRATLPVPVEPADRDTYTIRLTFDVIAWPAYLTQYHDS
jgi:hypothetical protein